MRNYSELIEKVTDIIGESLYPDNFGVLLLNEKGDTLHAHSSYRGVSIMGSPPSISLGQGISGQVATSGKPLRIPNVRNNKKYIEVTSQVRSELCVPIIHGVKVLGVINAESVKINAFTEADEHLLTTIASTLATALEKLRLFESEQQRRQDAEILREATTGLTTTLDLTSLQNVILDSLGKILQFDSASIALDQEGELRITIGKGFPADYQVIGNLLEDDGKWKSINDIHRSLIIPDVQTDPEFKQWEGSGYIRGWMGISMVASGKVIGYIFLDSREVDHFTKKDATQVETFANSAAVAIENARLFSKEQAQRKSSAVLLDLMRISASSLDLEEVMQITLERLSELVPSDSGTIQLVEDNFLRIAATLGLASNALSVGELIRLEDYPLNRRTLEDKLPIYIGNTTKESDYVILPGLERIRSFLGVPLIYKGEAIGLIILTSEEKQYFREQEIELSLAVARNAAIAIENARLYQSAKDSADRRAILHQLSQDVVQTLSLDDTYQAIYKAAKELMHCDAFVISLHDEVNKENIAAYLIEQNENYPTQTTPDSQGLASKVINSGKAIIINQFEEFKDERIFRFGSKRRVQSVLAVPMRVSNKTIGMLSAQCYLPNKYGKEEQVLLEMLASYGTTAIENARLFEVEQRRHREAETLRQAAMAVTATLDLESVLEALLLVMKQVIPYDSASVMLLEGDKLQLAAAQGFPNSEDIQYMQFTANDKLFIAVKNSVDPIIIKNAQNDKRFKKWAGTDFVRGWMGVPLILHHEVIGYITFDSRQENVYDEKIASLSQAFANQAAVAIQNARQFEAKQRHFEEAETLRQTAEAITLSLDIQQVLNAVLNNLSQVVPFDSAALFLIEGDMVRINAAKGFLKNNSVVDSLFPASNALLQKVSETGKPLILEDAQADPRFEKWAAADKIRGWMCIPLIARGVTIGYITIDSFTRGAYNEHDASLATAFAHQAAAAIENARLFERGEQQIRQLTALRDIDSTISSSFDLRATLNILIGHATRELKADAAVIFLYNPNLQALNFYTSTGLKEKFNSSVLHFRIGEGLAGQVALKRKIILVPNLTEFPELNDNSHIKDDNFKSYFGVPLIGKGQITGVLEIYTCNEIDPNPDWINFLHTLAGQAAIAIDSVQMFENLERRNQELSLAYDKTLEGWGRALELRDKETQGHTDRVVEMTVELARRMGVIGEDLTHIKRGTLLHDIGKLGIPDQILHKPEPLTEEEWVLMRQHPHYAYDLMRAIPYLQPALDIPFSHHERWDGSGYPKGLKGEDIPLPARIFAVVDIWDALLYDRVYRDAWPEEKVIEYLKNTAGIELDPEIVKVFLDLLEEEKRLEKK